MSNGVRLRGCTKTGLPLCVALGLLGALLGELYRAQTGEFAAESTVKALMTAVTYAKNQMLTGEELAQVQVEGVEFSKIFRDYEQALRQSRRMDYDDQMVYALRILRQHPRILEEFQGRFRYFCVDEAQDTSRIQHRIIRMLAGQSQNLFLVGDEDQSIYGFRAADPSALVRFPEDWPGARVLRLEQNYRSTREIVAAADRFTKILRLNDFSTTAFCGFVVAFSAMLIQELCPFKVSGDVMIMSAIMYLVPGIPFTTAARDTINGDYAAGSARMLECIVVALAVAVGVGFGMVCFRTLWGGTL